MGMKTCTIERNKRVVSDYKKGMGSEDVYFTYGLVKSSLRDILVKV